jgi:DHA1 family multidrug resistance protein-like MFS transporter
MQWPRWLLQRPNRSFSATPAPSSKLDRRDIASVLGLRSFSEDEIRQSFNQLKHSETAADINVSSLHQKVNHLVTQKYPTSAQDPARLSRKVGQIVDVIAPSQSTATIAGITIPVPAAIKDHVETDDQKDKQQHQVINYESYRSTIRSFGEKIDMSVVVPVTVSFLMTGTSVGIVIPCMPVLVSQLGITPSGFSLVISAFGLSKLLGNIPSAYYVDTVGRKPMLVAGLVLCAVGVGGVGFIESLSSSINPLLMLIASRFAVGIGVSAFSSGAMIMMTDISTPLNRARTMAPIQAGFQGGVALGPAIGGFAINSIGIPNTFLSCGALFGAIAAFNAAFTQETKQKSNRWGPAAPLSPPMTPPVILAGDTKPQPLSAAIVPNPSGVKESFGVAIRVWKELLKNKDVRSLCLTNMGYWTALSGVQMTILPIHMVNALHLGPVEIGGSFALMSACSVLVSQPIAYLADKHGKDLTMSGGFGLLAASMAALPFAANFEQLLATLLPLSIVSNALASIPTAKMADVADHKSRAQALSLIRTVGDVGLLIGAGMGGLMLQFATMQTAVHSNSALMLGLSLVLARRVWMRKKGV